MELAQIVQPLLNWYRINRRDLPWRREKTPYAVYVSEIMLQQTRVEAVKGYYLRFMDELPDVRSLASAPEELLLKLWEGLGYYSRVRNMQKTAQALCERFGGTFPKDEESLLSLPGVGPYTAAAVASIAFNQKKAAVDGNVLRVYARLMADGQDSSKPAFRQKVKAELEAVYPDDASTFTQAWMELGALQCTPRSPNCETCPLKTFCVSHAQDAVLSYPVKPAKKARRIEERTVLLLICGDRLALRKRPDKGLLAGLWELPNMDGRQTAEQVGQLPETEGLYPVNTTKGRDYTHVFSHVEWRMCSYAVEVRKPSPLYTWVTWDELADAYALPSAFAPFLENGAVR